MDKASIEKALEGILDQLSQIEHERWSHWQKYMHEKCVPQLDGSLVVPADLVNRWERQIATPYRELSEKEKESDREQVRRYLPFIAQALSEG